MTWREITEPALPEPQGILCWRELNGFPDYYSDLRIARNASSLEVKTAYRRLALKCHPDLNQFSSSESAERRMQQLNLAYQVLSSPARREAYDRSIG
ncbi:J domain-containing protein [Tunturiibacter gelidiferens]|uniref:J domain-containing protein n=1 Tax=Tunturiibacter gelidiferens TaxID=3069689 RepID=UPI003D9BCF5A